MAQLTITYLNHSGFSVVCEKTCLIFDYYPAVDRKAGTPGVIGSADLEPYDRVLVFASHSHEDHFDPSIYEWQDEGRVHYILGYDIPERWPGLHMSPGMDEVIAGVRVRSYESTDLGVSYLVTLDGMNIFHAGDLNLWHWRDTATVREIAQAEDAFYAAVKPIEEETIDVAFFPVDPRQGSLCDAGALYFVMSVKPTLMIPMHFQGRGDVAADFARKNRSRRTNIVALTRRGQTVVYEETVREEEPTLAPELPRDEASEAAVEATSEADAPAGETPEVQEEMPAPEVEKEEEPSLLEAYKQALETGEAVPVLPEEKESEKETLAEQKEETFAKEDEAPL